MACDWRGNAGGESQWMGDSVLSTGGLMFRIGSLPIITRSGPISRYRLGCPGVPGMSCFRSGITTSLMNWSQARSVFNFGSLARRRWKLDSSYFSLTGSVFQASTVRGPVSGGAWEGGSPHPAKQNTNETIKIFRATLRNRITNTPRLLPGGQVFPHSGDTISPPALVASPS